MTADQILAEFAEVGVMNPERRRALAELLEEARSMRAQLARARQLGAPDQILAELKAAAAIVQRHRPAAVLFRLTCDRAGNVRLVLERVEGIPLAALAGDALTGAID
jgi:hypothetical protein